MIQDGKIIISIESLLEGLSIEDKRRVILYCSLDGDIIDEVLSLLLEDSNSEGWWISDLRKARTRIAEEYDKSSILLIRSLQEEIQRLHSKIDSMCQEKPRC